jgi:Protein of unknown function (DUF3179)
MDASTFRLLKTPRTWIAILALACAELGVALGLYAVERVHLRATQNDVAYGSGTAPKRLRKFEMPGLKQPPAVLAPASKIVDADEVIGIVVNGKPRAYWLKALKYPPWHVVNDVVAGLPVSVTHCDRTNCTRVFSDGASSVPLDVNVGGIYGTELVVKIDGVLYFQQSGKPFDADQPISEFPYPDYPWERTSWREWKTRHPDTDVFIGHGPGGPKP